MFDMKVWIYSGQTVSEIYKDLFTVPSVLIIHEHRDHYDAVFMLHFQGQWIRLQESLSKKATRHFCGNTKDSRGFDIEWRLNVSGDEITGFYKMDYDRGSLQLNLASLQKNPSPERRVAHVAH